LTKGDSAFHCLSHAVFRRQLAE
jgi:transcription elongation factor GreA